MRRHIQGDASSRSYERLFLGASRAILMNSPPRPDGPAIRGGKTYSDDRASRGKCSAFRRACRGRYASADSARRKFSRPISKPASSSLEDLGSEGIVGGDPPAPDRGSATPPRSTFSWPCTIRICPRCCPSPPRIEHELPPYDLEAFSDRARVHAGLVFAASRRFSACSARCANIFSAFGAPC